jgi:hypothetical protein
MLAVFGVAAPALCARGETTSSAWSRYEADLVAAHRRAVEAKPSGPDSLTREALSSFYSNDRRRLAQIYEQAWATENAAGDTRELRQSDSILYLFNNTIPDREQFLVAQEVAAKEVRSEELRTRILLSLLDDDYYEINQLKGENRFNRFTRVFNRASSSLSKLALFQPQDAAQLLLDAAYSLHKAKSTTERERRMIFLAGGFLKKHPDAHERPEVEELLAQLHEKIRGDWVKSEVAAGRIALDKENHTAAIFHLENAVLLDSSNADAMKLLGEARSQRDALEKAREEFLSVLPGGEQLSKEENAVLAGVARALVAADSRAMETQLSAAGRLAGSVRYATAALLEQRGDHDSAIAALRELSESAPDSADGRAARAVLANPSYNLDAAFDAAVEEMRRERQKYILTGRRTVDENAYVFGSAAVQSVGQSVAGIPALFVTDMLVRGVAERFRTQVGIDQVVDAGARYIRKYPKSARSAGIAGQIASLSAKSGEFSQSREYLKIAGDDDPKKLAKLRENEARQLFERASGSSDLVERKRLLEEIVRDYPGFKISATASRELEKLQPTIGEGAIVLTRKMLAADPEFMAALGLPAELVDNDKKNGEIADRGLALDASGRTFSYKLKDGDAFQTGKVPSKDRERVIARARALQTSAVFGASGKETLQRRVLPVQVEGGAGGSGVEVAPKLIPYPEKDKDSRYFK